jgi:glycerol kinase
MGDFFLKRTGLMIDAYFSATKIKWVLENNLDAKKKAQAGDLLFGTVDSWLLWKLTGQKIHRTDATNASRTMLYNIYKLEWDAEILKILGIPGEILPEVCHSAFSFGKTDPEITGGVAIPIAGVAGDQQAALFGQGCFSPGESKNTYGTGAFMLMYTGEKPSGERHNRLLTTLCANEQGKPAFAIEGSVFNCGSAVQWMRDQLGIITSASETEALAQSISSSQGVYFVPAFTGLGAPYWDMYARGAIVGLTRGAGKKELVRAALESMAYQTKDLFDCMCDFAKETPSALKVDGGAAANNFLMQFQSDLLHVDIDRPYNLETTAMGAAYLAGLSIGFWSKAADLKNLQVVEKRFSPRMRTEESAELYRGWKKAIKQVRCI